MKTNRDLLKDAIADAKTIKETAVVNAKKALEESFAPHLQTMLSKKLEEMEQEELEEAEELEEVEAIEESEELEENEEIMETPEAIQEEELEDDEINLDELLAELEEGEEVVAEAETEEEESEEETETGEEEAEETEEEDEDISIEDMTEAELEVFIKDLIADMIASGELEGGEVEVGAEEEIEEPMMAEVENLRLEVKQKDADLKEALNTVKLMTKQLNEMNLFNAKLLYTNKIFKEKTLSENQKMKVLSTFDKATSTKEAKLIYETLMGSIKSTSTKSPIKESMMGSASKVTKVVKKEPIIETNNVFSRMQKLAGII